MKKTSQQLLHSLREASPEEIAMIVSLGLVLGVFPIAWGPTLLCTAAAAALRLNIPSIQIVNQLATPLQIVLLAPFSLAGRAILAHDSVSIWNRASDALTGWCFISLPAGIMLYAVLLYRLRRKGNPRAETLAADAAL